MTTAESEVLFRWPHGGKTSEAGTPLSAEKDGKAFSGTVPLPRGKHRFRFVVDGRWRHDAQLITERDEETGELHNVVEVSANSALRLQLPEKATDYMNSLKEYGLRTPEHSPPKSAVSSSIYFGGSSDTATASTVAAAAAAAATAVAPPGEEGSSGSMAATANLAQTAAAAATAAEGSLVREFGGVSVGSGSLAAGKDGGGGDQEVEAAARARAMSRRRQEAEASSLAAVGACLVTSSVRKDGKLIVAMVGLPGCGKSFIARAIVRHLDWIGLKSRIFSVKDRRRKEVAVYEPAEYFEAGGEGEKIRIRLAAEVLNEALEALQSDIDIAIYDASNINQQRRRLLKDSVAASGLHAKVVFIESICNDEVQVQRNIKAIKQSSPEFVEKTQEEVEREIRSRIELYKRIYEPLNADEGHSFIKLIDAGSQMVTNLISGYIPGRITLLCLNLHLKPRPIWMSRHGESEFNMQGRIGGDAPLTPAGKVYAVKLAEFMKRRYPPRRHQQQQQQQQQQPSSTLAVGPAAAADTASAGGGGCGGVGEACGDSIDDEEELVVWTSTMLRTGQTVAPMALHREVMKWSQLTEINAGLMDSMTYEYVASEMPAEYEARQKDKLRYRYPGGESYQDLFLRLEPVIFEMLRERSPLLVVGHQAILRVLYGYLTGKEPGECPTIHMPLHTAIKLTPRAYSCEEEWYRPLEECGVEDAKETAHKMG